MTLKPSILKIVIRDPKPPIFCDSAYSRIFYVILGNFSKRFFYRFRQPEPIFSFTFSKIPSIFLSNVSKILIRDYKPPTFFESTCRDSYSKFVCGFLSNFSKAQFFSDMEIMTFSAILRPPSKIFWRDLFVDLNV